MDPVEEAAQKIRGNMNRPGGFAGVPTPPQSTTTSLPGFYTPPAPSNNPLYLNSPVPAPPAMGYGGGNYNQMDNAGQKQIDELASRLKSNPAFVQSEIARTNDVIKNRSGAGQGITEQQDYLTRLQGMVPKPQMQPANQSQPAATAVPVSAAQSAPSAPTSNVPAPPSNSIYTPMDKSQIEAEAAARIAKQRTGVKQGVDATKTGLKNTFDYNNQILRDNRVLEDSSFNDRVNPYGGRYDYLKNNVLRDRSIQDTASQKDYASATGAADQKLADFDTMAPEQQQNIMNDLQRIERDYGMQQGQLTGNFNGGRTLAGQNADWQRVTDTANLTGQFGGGQTLAAKNQAFNQGLQQKQYNLAEQNQQFNQQHTTQQDHINLANFLTQQYGVPVYPTEDPAEAYAQVAGIPTTAARKIAMDSQKMGFDMAIKQATLENTINKTQADIALKAASQAETAGYHSTMAQASQDRASAAKQNADTNANKQPKPDKNAEIGKIVSDVDQMTPDMRKTFFKEQKANIIAEHGTAGYNQLYNMYYDNKGDPVEG